MRKLLSITLALVLCLSVVSILPSVALSETTAADGFTLVDLTTDYYCGESAVGGTRAYNSSYVSVVDDTTYGKAFFIQSAGANNTAYLRGLRLAGSTQTPFTIENGKRYQVIYDIKVNCSTAVYMTARAMTPAEGDYTGESFSGVSDVGVFWNKAKFEAANDTAWRTNCSFTFPAEGTGDLAFVFQTDTTSAASVQIYLANIRVREVKPVEYAEMVLDDNDIAEYIAGNKTNIGITNTYHTVIDDAECESGKALKLSTLPYKATQYTRAFKLIDKWGAVAYVQEGNTYSIKFKIKANSAYNFGVDVIYRPDVNGLNVSSGGATYADAPVSFSAGSIGYTQVEIIFVADQSNGACLAFWTPDISSSAKSDNIDIRVSDISIEDITNTTASTVVDFNNANYYFELYSGGYNFNSSYSKIIDDDEAHGKVISFNSIGPKPSISSNSWARAMRLADSKSNELTVESGKQYTVSYDIKRVANTADFTFAPMIKAEGSSLSGTKQAYVEGAGKTYTAATDAAWLTNESFVFTADASGELAVGFFASSGSSDQDIRVDNIKVEEIADVAITYNGIATDDTFATSAKSTDTYEAILPEIEDVEWYLDAGFTTAATGAIGIKDVTVYAKILPSFGTETPRSAGLFVAGKDESTNAGIEGTSGSAVYEIGGVKYAAFRVFGTYVAPAKTDGEGADYGKIVVDANGTTKDIVSRHVMLGYKAEPTLDNNYAMSSVSATFENCWSTVKNADGTYTVTYSLLLKNIPEQYKGTTFYANSAIVTADATYTGEALSGVSAQAVYDAAKDSTIGWFE